MSKLPKGHIATKQGEIDAHGRHVDMIAKTEFGSHQVRYDRYGRMISDQLNFRGGDRFDVLSNGLPDPRGTAMGGYNPR